MNEAKRKRGLLSELEALLPSECSPRKAKRARLDGDAGPAAGAGAAAAAEVIDLTND